MKKFRNGLFFITALAVYPGIALSPQAYAQEAPPIEIEAYVFFLAQDAMDSYLKQGISRTELEEMQKKHFAETGLLPTGEPLSLTVGDNNAEIPSDRYELLRKASDKQLLVFLFDLRRSKETAADEKWIARRSYAIVTNADSTVKQERVIDDKLRFPANARQYRYVDFRSAAILKSGHVGYELFLGDNKTVKLILNPPRVK